MTTPGNTVTPEMPSVRLTKSDVEELVENCPRPLPGEEVFTYIPAATLTEARELLEACKKKAEFDGAYAGGCSCVLCQEWRELIKRIDSLLERTK